MVAGTQIKIYQEKLAAGSDWLEETQMEKAIKGNAGWKTKKKSQLAMRCDDAKTTVEHQPWQWKDGQKLQF